MYPLFYLVLMTFVVACAMVPDVSDRALVINKKSGARECRQLFDDSEQIINHEKVGDSQAVKIAAYPYLRSNRWLASFKYQVSSDKAFASWLDELQNLGMEGLQVELANLSQAGRAQLPKQAVFTHCTAILRQTDFAGASWAVKEKLIKAVDVPDEYQTWKRIIGLYWLTAWATQYGTENLYDEIRDTYKNPVPLENSVTYLAPARPAADKVPWVMERAYGQHPLGIPQLKAGDRALLFAAFAPNITVATKTENDRIGRITWSEESETPVVITGTPTVYQYLSYTRFNQQILLQLNYIFWFPSRPKQSAMDYLGGNIDGLTWRVTLSKQGLPLAYDSIHNCGCYHLFFPTDKSCLKQLAGVLEEPAFSFQQLTSTSHKPLTLQLAHTSHYLDRVLEQAEVGENLVEYQWADYNSLRSVAKPGTENLRQSIFQTDGVVAGTERGERFFLWPMGIPAPGEMRQWGHHATAFYGRRHFDDANIIERYIGTAGDQTCQ
ncbi:MAG: hypothetical protein P8H32_09855 [Oceanicoccus sp.]|uniref:hypothetical protein n=1 Tax=Oceanicoccus sp. TaxID=2691044 RepID=UPI00261CE242|nr:hypothetical protein [Oceanicoccus sp.]MDG1773721.1 hypothetical protein [Oceanicoccus sp.]